MRTTGVLRPNPLPSSLILSVLLFSFLALDRDVLPLLPYYYAVHCRIAFPCLEKELCHSMSDHNRFLLRVLIIKQLPLVYLRALPGLISVISLTDPLAMNPRTPRVSADSSSLSERKKAVGQDDHHNSSSSSTFTRAPSPIHLNNPNFSMQQLTLNSAVSPLLSRVAAPFDKSERKRAHTSALYYSECFHRGIQPLDADHAAKGAQEQYDKWWIDRTAKGIQPPKLMSRSTVEQSKRRRIDQEQSNSLTTPSAGRKIASSEEQKLRVNEINIQVDAPSPVVKSFGNEEMSTSHHAGDIAAAKRQLIVALKESQGDVATPKFLHNMRILEHFYKSKSWDGRGTCDHTPFSLEGNWLTISKPTYDECRGRNENGDLKYNLGRMSFGMFRPTNMVCSVQASFNNVRTIDPKSPDRPLHVPKKLMKEIQSGQILLRTYE